ncbi:hypothetical protein LguiA_002144 [Lonicera macranthoides]
MHATPLDKDRLIEDVYIQEAERIKSQPFDSHIEQNKYLELCGSAHDTALDNLKSALDAVQKFFPIDPTKGDIANNTLTYVELGINVAFQTLRNYSVKLSYVQKLSDHANALLSALEELDPQNVINARRLANDAIKYKDAMVRLWNEVNEITLSRSGDEGGKKLRWSKLGEGVPSTMARGSSKEGKAREREREIESDGSFPTGDGDRWRWRGDRERQISGDGDQRGWRGAYGDRWVGREVYKKIIKESGQEDIFQMETDITEVGGVAVFLLTAGIMVWDIFTSAHVETFARDSVQTMANIGGGLIGNVVAEVAATIVADTILASEIFLTGVALLSGIGATFIIAEIAGLFLDMIFGSGGKKVLSTDNIKCYVAPLPDGAEIANQIFHDKNIQASARPLGAKHNISPPAGPLLRDDC